MNLLHLKLSVLVSLRIAAAACTVESTILEHDRILRNVLRVGTNCRNQQYFSTNV